MVIGGTGAPQCVSQNECYQHKHAAEGFCRRGAVQNNEPHNDWHRQTQRMMCGILESRPASCGWCQ